MFIVADLVSLKPLAYSNFTDKKLLARFTGT